MTPFLLIPGLNCDGRIYAPAATVLWPHGPVTIANHLAGEGVGGIAASSWKDRAVPASINYSRVLFYVMGVLAILGIIPDTRTIFGYVPLYNGHIGVSVLLAVLGAYFGYRLPIAAHDRLVERHLDPKHA